MNSGKRRRDWVLAVSAGLCSSLVPACQMSNPWAGSRAGQSVASAPLAEPTPSAPSNPRPGAAPLPVGDAAAPSTQGALTSSYAPAAPLPTTAASTNVSQTVANNGPSSDSARPKSAPLGVISRGKAHPDVEPTRVGNNIIPDVSVGSAPILSSEPSEPPSPVKTSSVKPPPDPAIVLALRCFLDKHPAEAIGLLKKYDKVSQELLLCLLPLVAQFSENGATTSQQSGVIIDTLNNLIAPLQALAPLTIDKLSFCQKIDAFGIFEALPADYIFQPEEQVRIYAELRNFTSERKEQPTGSMYVTRLASAVEIRDLTDRHLVWQRSFHRACPDQSQTQRHDYFEQYCFCLPALKPGWYKLEILVTDVATQRSTRRSLDFLVALPGHGS